MGLDYLFVQLLGLGLTLLLAALLLGHTLRNGRSGVGLMGSELSRSLRLRGRSGIMRLELGVNLASLLTRRGHYDQQLYNACI